MKRSRADGAPSPGKRRKARSRGPGKEASEPRTHRRKWGFAGVIAAVLVAAVLGLYPKSPRPSGETAEDTQTVPDIVVPSDPEELDSQLRAYLDEQIARAREDPSDAGRHATMGLIYSANARWSEARDSFRNATTLDSENFLAAYYLAAAEQELGNDKAAADILRDLIKGHPDFAPAHHRLGVLLLAEKSVEEAQAAFQRAVDLAPQAPQGYIGLADAALRERRYERATELLETALRINRNIGKAHYLLGMAYRGMGRLEDARRELKRGADSKTTYIADPWSPERIKHAKGIPFQMRLGQRFLQHRRPQEAAAVLETLLKWHPNNVEALNDLAIAYMRLKRHDEALELLRRAEQLDSHSMATHINLAACFSDLGQLDEALSQAERAVELSPSTAQAHAVKGRVLLKLRRPADAAAAYKEAAHLDPQNAGFNIGLANAYIVQGRLADAREGYEAAIALAPSSVEAQLRLCDVCIRLGDLDRAETALAAARRVAPNLRQVAAMTRRLQRLRNEQRED